MNFSAYVAAPQGEFIQDLAVCIISYSCACLLVFSVVSLNFFQSKQMEKGGIIVAPLPKALLYGGENLVVFPGECDFFRLRAALSEPLRCLVTHAQFN